MRQGQHSKKNRGRSRRQPNPVNRVFESNGPDVKIRGNASHISEKYLALARDAQSSGDPIAAENYLQHAEHYLRIIAAANAQQASQGSPCAPGQQDQGDRAANGRGNGHARGQSGRENGADRDDSGEEADVSASENTDAGGDKESAKATEGAEAAPEGSKRRKSRAQRDEARAQSDEDGEVRDAN